MLHHCTLTCSLAMTYFGHNWLYMECIATIYNYKTRLIFYSHHFNVFFCVYEFKIPLKCNQPLQFHSFRQWAKVVIYQKDIYIMQYCKGTYDNHWNHDNYLTKAIVFSLINNVQRFSALFYCIIEKKPLTKLYLPPSKNSHSYSTHYRKSCHYL